MNTLQENSKNKHESKKILKLISKLSWVFLLKINIYFQGLGYKVELQYQPFIENKIFMELIEKSDEYINFYNE